VNIVKLITVKMTSFIDIIPKVVEMVLEVTPVYGSWVNGSQVLTRDPLSVLRGATAILRLGDNGSSGEVVSLPTRAD